MSSQLTLPVLSNIPPPFGPARVVIIGTGDPSHIPKYAEETSCNFPIFSDDGNRIHSKLDLPGVFNDNPGGCMSARNSTYSTELSGQNCGDLIFNTGECVWAHRSGHITPDILIQVLRNTQ